MGSPRRLAGRGHHQQGTNAECMRRAPAVCPWDSMTQRCTCSLLSSTTPLSRMPSFLLHVDRPGAVGHEQADGPLESTYVEAECDARAARFGRRPATPLLGLEAIAEVHLVEVGEILQDGHTDVSFLRLVDAAAVVMTLDAWESHPAPLRLLHARPEGRQCERLRARRLDAGPQGGDIR